MAISKPLDWIKTLDAALVELDEAPQFGMPEPFPWAELEKSLQDLFETPSLKLDWTVKGWTKAGEANDQLLPLAISWAPLDHPVCFAMSQQDLKGLMSELLKGEERASYFFDNQLLEGFYRYFAAEVLFQLNKLHFASSLSGHVDEEGGAVYTSFKHMPAFVVDVSFALNGKVFWGKVLFSEAFRAAWKAFFIGRHPPLSEEMRFVPVELGLDIGYCRLSLEEWKQVKLGDLVILDYCSYDPEEKSGGFALTLNHKPLFRGRLKEGGIKLTEYPRYEEVGTSMEEEFDSEEEDLYGDLDEDSEFEDEEDFDTEEELEEEAEEESKTPSVAPVSEEKPFIAPEKLPVHLTVEAGRIKMTVEELMKLAPGNLIDLRVFPEQGVDLVVNGKRVGRGELVRMGEMLGVRILSLS